MSQQPAPQQGGPAASRAWPARLAQLVLVVSAGGWVGAKLLGAGGLTVEDLLALLVFAGFVGVGTLIVTRRPGNRVGWLMVAGGALWAIGLAALDVAYRAIVTARAACPPPRCGRLGARRCATSAGTC